MNNNIEETKVEFDKSDVVLTFPANVEKVGVALGDGSVGGVLSWNISSNVYQSDTD